MYPFGAGMSQPHATSSSSGYNPNSQPAGMPAGVPFGAGWVAPTQHPHQQQQQQTNLNYQPLPSHQSHTAPYPNYNNNSAPYPTNNGAGAPYPSNNGAGAPYPSNNGAGAPYPTNSGGGGAPYPTSTPYPHTTPYPSNQPPHTAPYPSNQPHYPPSGNHTAAPYPGSSYPHNPQQTHYPPPATSSAQPPQQPPPSSTSPQHHHQQQQHSPFYSPLPNHPSHYNPQHGYTPVRTSCGLESPAGNMQHCFEELAQRQGHPIQHHLLPRKEGTPTIQPAQSFDPVKDAHDLRKAMKGFGTDEDGLINIICRRSNEQRQEIQRQYKTHFGKDLIEDIKSETSGNFEKLLVGLLRPIVDYYCCEMNDAMAGIGTDEDVLIEILCTLSNNEIHIIKNQYLRLYGAHLESELKSETSGNFKRLLVSLCAAARDESGLTNREAAQTDARELLKAGELRVGTDESMFNMILCQRNYQQLKLIFQEYEHMTGHSLEKAIKKEFSGDIMEGLIAIYRCCTNKAEYFASRLHKSMAGIGTNDKQLIRVIITRCEIDLADIKAAYERIYGKSLKSWIKGDTSGHYKHALYALIGEQRSNS